MGIVTDRDIVIRAIAENGIRRLPVVDQGKLVGIVSPGDLAKDRDAGPPLAEISAALPNN